jgi:hypothetical protein
VARWGKKGFKNEGESVEVIENTCRKNVLFGVCVEVVKKKRVKDFLRIC